MNCLFVLLFSRMQWNKQSYTYEIRNSPRCARCRYIRFRFIRSCVVFFFVHVFILFWRRSHDFCCCCFDLFGCLFVCCLVARFAFGWMKMCCVWWPRANLEDRDVCLMILLRFPFEVCACGCVRVRLSVWLNVSGCVCGGIECGDGGGGDGGGTSKARLAGAAAGWAGDKWWRWW